MIVGGGIRSPEVAQGIVRAGADVIVTGNIIEDSIEQAKRIIRAVKKGRR